MDWPFRTSRHQPDSSSRLGVRVVLAALVVLAFGCGLAFADGSGPAGGELPAPVSVGERERLLGELRERERVFEAHRASAAAVAERERSRAAFGGLARAEAVSLLRDEFQGVLTEPLFPRVELREGERLVGYDGDFDAVVERPDGGRVVARSLGLPLRSARGSGASAPVDLTLQDTGSGVFGPANPLVPVSVSGGGEVDLPGSGVGFRLAGSRSVDLEPVEGDRLFAPDVFEDLDLVVAPTALGARVAFQVRSPRAPERATLEFDLPDGAAIRRAPGPAASPGFEASDLLEVVRDGQVLARVLPPAAWDAEGAPVDAAYELDGDRVTVAFPHRGKDLLYPLLVDPDVQQPFGGFTASSNWAAVAVPATYWYSSIGDGGLHISSATGTFDSSSYGQWSWRSSWEWTITRGDFTGLWFSPGNTSMCMRVGIWHDQTGIENSKFDHCGTSLANYSATVNAPAGTAYATNALVYSMVPLGPGVRYQQAHLSMYGAIAYMRDVRIPEVTSVSAPSGWLAPQDVTISVAGADSPTGVSHFALKRSGQLLDYGGSACDTNCPATKTATVTWPATDLVNGANTGQIIAYDGHGNPSQPTEFAINVDAGPSITASGPLWDAVQAGTELESPAEYALNVAATDSASKMSRLAVYIDDELQAESTVGAGTDSISLSMNFRSSESEPGDHEWRIEATAGSAQTSTTTPPRLKVAKAGFVPKMGVNLRPWDDIDKDQIRAKMGPWFQRLQNNGIRYARILFNYRKYKLATDDPTTPGYNEKFVRWDRVVDEAADHNVQLLPVLGNIRLPGDSGAGDWWVPDNDEEPANEPENGTYTGPGPSDWRNFASDFAARYKVGPNRDLAHSIQAWEVWNEPNLDGFFQGDHNADYYENFVLDPASQAIKSANPSARVLVGGLAEPTLGAAADFLDNMLSGTHKADGDYIFDIVSFHPYWETTDKVQQAMSAIRGVLAAYDLPAKKAIWATEFGYADREQASLATQPFQPRYRCAPQPPATSCTTTETTQAQSTYAFLDFLQSTGSSGQRGRDTYRSGPQFIYPEEGNEDNVFCDGGGTKWYCYSGLWKASSSQYLADGPARAMLSGFSYRATHKPRDYSLPASFGGSGWGS